jgi:cytochrome c553
VRALILAACLAGAMAPGADAGDAAAGRQKARMCQTCHGLDGMSKQPNAPHIAGQVEAYLVKSMTDFKDGVRANEQMSVLAPGLTEADIADLAAYYASIKITAEQPQ